MKVVSEPPIRFTCRSCGAVNEGKPEEFRARHTMPPSYDARCAFCGCTSVCYPTPLIAREVGAMAPAEALAYVASRLR
jgi:hypothetical protein